MKKNKFYRIETELSYNDLKKHNFNYKQALWEADGYCEEISEDIYKQEDEIISAKFNGVRKFIITTYERWIYNEKTDDYESYDVSDEIDYEF